MSYAACMSVAKAAEDYPYIGYGEYGYGRYPDVIHSLQFERLMSACIAVMFVAVVVTGAMARPDWGAVARGLIPSLPRGESRVVSRWSSFSEAKQAYDQIIPYQTQREELGRLGFSHMTAKHAVAEATRYAITGRQLVDPESGEPIPRAETIRQVVRDNAGFFAIAAVSRTTTYSAKAPPAPPKTSSPGSKRLTASPTASTTPAKSLPSRVSAGLPIPDISRMIGTDRNVAFKIGIGEIPLLHQVTFSIWPDTTSMAAFARENGPHAAAIRAVREGNWFAEELYARFAILGETGAG